MRSSGKIVTIDQGTTSTRAIRYNKLGEQEAISSEELKQFYPNSGWVEEDPEEIWMTALCTLKRVLDNDVKAIGITNQRETIVIWERASGKPIYNAIIWQDRRSGVLCSELEQKGVEGLIREKTGLLIDPYFSATKIAWVLQNVPGAYEKAKAGELAFGTIDTFLLWRLTGGKSHATDVTNASRTMLFNIHTFEWDAELLKLFDIPESILPTVHPNTFDYGETSLSVLGQKIPVTGMIGDQQSALVGQGCFKPGMIKSTYGTGCFMLANVGATAVASENRLLTSVAYSIGDEKAYALEGSIFVAGAAIKWLRDTMGLIASADQTSQMAESVPAEHGVYFVPAFVGMGAPHWRPDVRAMITGMTFDTSASYIARAALEAVAFQTCDLVETMKADGLAEPKSIRIDGGMAANQWFSQFLSDVLALPVERQESMETTAKGAAFIAGLQYGLWDNLETVQAMATPASRFTPTMPPVVRLKSLQNWRAAVQHTLLQNQMSVGTTGELPVNN